MLTCNSNFQTRLKLPYHNPAKTLLLSVQLIWLKSTDSYHKKQYSTRLWIDSRGKHVTSIPYSSTSIAPRICSRVELDLHRRTMNFRTLIQIKIWHHANGNWRGNYEIVRRSLHGCILVANYRVTEDWIFYSKDTDQNQNLELSFWGIYAQLWFYSLQYADLHYLNPMLR